MPLWLTLWHENEVACLFADTNMGKSIYAVQIAKAISSAGRRVIYFDFELSDKQFQLRYTDPDTDKLYPFSPLLIRSEFAKTSMPETISEVVDCIEAEIVNKRCKIVIIDNITWICNRSESGDAAGELMTLLIGLKRKWGLSILCLAHTPKRAITTALTQNSLAGSKRIANFMDSLFAIEVDRTNQPSGRYVKQIKVRSAELTNGEERVLRYEIVKEHSMLHFKPIGTGNERMLLAGSSDEDKEAQHSRIIELAGSGMSQRAIAEEVGLSQSCVCRVLLRHRESEQSSLT